MKGSASLSFGTGSAGEHFMDVGLVAHVKEDPVLIGVVYPVKGYGELHRAKIGGKMSAGAGDFIHKEAADLLA